jgi:hypothetical protein
MTGRLSATGKGQGMSTKSCHFHLADGQTPAIPVRAGSPREEPHPLLHLPDFPTRFIGEEHSVAAVSCIAAMPGCGETGDPRPAKGRWRAAASRSGTGKMSFDL